MGAKTTTNSTCPICRTAVATESRCPRCTWTLSDGPWLGAISAEHRRGFDSRFQQAQREHDLRAAARAAGYPHAGDEKLLRDLRTRLRGGTPTDAEIHSARTASVATLQSTMDVVRAELRWLAASGAPGRTLTLIDIDRSDLLLVRWRTSIFGAPIRTGPERRIPWRTLLPDLPTDPADALFLLAGGVGKQYPGEPAIDRTELDASLGARNDPAHRIRVLHRLPGWPIPERVAAAFEGVRYVHGPRPDDEFLSAAARHTPLREDHGLVVVAVDEHGATRPFVHPLFRAGAIAARDGTATVSITAADKHVEMVVAVVTGRGDTPPGRCRPLAVWQCSAATDTTRTLTFALERPGRVRLNAPAATPLTVSAEQWRELVEAIPARHHPAARSMDVAFAIELGGTPAEVADRRALIIDTLTRIADHHPAPERVRAAVIGYREHSGVGKQNVLSNKGFRPLTTARADVEELAAVRVLEQYAAPLEDAFAGAYRLGWRPLPTDRRLVIVGSRPPYSGRDGSAGKCPNAFDWRVMSARLRSIETTVLAVWDPPSWSAKRSSASRDAAKVWRELSAPHQVLRLTDASAKIITERAFLLGTLTAEEVAPLRFPITNAGTDQEYTV